MTPPFNKPRGIQGEERREGQLEYFTFLTSQGLAQGDIYCFASSCGYHRKDFKVKGKCPAKCLRGSLEGKGPLVKLHRVKAFISMSLREFRILKTEFLGIDSILLTLEIWGDQRSGGSFRVTQPVHTECSRPAPSSPLCFKRRIAI